MLDELGGQVDVVIQSILGLLRVTDVTAVANSRFNDTIRGANGVNTEK